LPRLSGFEKESSTRTPVLAQSSWYRFEPQPEGADRATLFLLSSVEPRRGSFFLRSSIPDAELLELRAQASSRSPQC
jgi:hypothetical protein